MKEKPRSSSKVEHPRTGVNSTPEGVFDGLNARVIQQILPFSHEVYYRKDAQVMMSGTEARHLYYVEKGTVEVSYTVHETRITVALIGSGDFFGEIGFFDGISRVRDIRASEDTVVRVFDPETLQRLQHENPLLYGDFLTLMAQSICQKFRRVVEENEPLMAYAASLSTGRRSFEESRPVPPHFFNHPEWHFINSLVEDYKALFFDLSLQLQQDSQAEIPDELWMRCHEIMNGFNDRLWEVEERFKKAEVADFAWGYIFKEIFPYFMRSRFAQRAYYKPRGYAGDFLMMEMIYRNQPEGDGKVGLLVDSWCLNGAASKAVRGRRRFLSEQLESLYAKRQDRDNPCKIMNLACGSNRELFDFLSGCENSGTVEALCIDADRQALEYTNQNVNNFSHSASIRLMSDNVVKWSLGRIRHSFPLQDIIYSAGLTDYLDERLFLAMINRCHEYLKPGGTLIIGNFGPENVNKVFMDHILQWKLIHRTEAQLKDLFTRSSFGVNADVLAEENGVNLFAVATKAN